MIVVAGVTNVQFSVPVDGFPVAYAPVRYPQGQTGVRVAGVGYNVAAGLAALGGEVRLATFLGDDLRKRDPKFQSPRYKRYLEAVEKLSLFARDIYGKKVIHLAVRWVLDQPGVSVALWGARRSEQLDPIAEVMGWRLDPKALLEVDRIVRNAVKDPVGPEFMAPPTREQFAA